MGFIDKLVQVANSQRGVLEGAVEILKKQGVGGIVDDFKKKGLADVVSSWVGKGKNIPIDVEQIKAALGSEKIKNLALSAGVSEENASHFLGTVLPELIDQLTPDGHIPDDDPFGKADGDQFSRGEGDEK